MNTDIVKKSAGYGLVFIGTLGVLGLVYFYNSILFTGKWQSLDQIDYVFRLMYSIPAGISVMYALFFALFIPLLACVFMGLGLLSGKRYITKHQKNFIVLIWIFTIVFGSVTTIFQAQKTIERVGPFSDNPIAFDVEIPYTIRYVFKTTLKNEVTSKLGMPIDGYEPAMFLKLFPGLTETDFEGVEASVGSYTVKEGRLVHVTDNTKLIHSAVKAVTDRGMDTLLKNVSLRLKVDLTKDGTLTEIMEALVRPDTK